MYSGELGRVPLVDNSALPLPPYQAVTVGDGVHRYASEVPGKSENLGGCIVFAQIHFGE